MSSETLQEVIAEIPALSQYAERMFLLKEFLPSRKGVVLSVGCESYNRLDFRLIGSEAVLLTVDSNPHNEKFGSPSGHFVSDFLNLNSLMDISSVDTLILFGVLGVKIDDPHYNLDEDLEEMFRTSSRLLKPGGELLIAPDCRARRMGLCESYIRFQLWHFRLSRQSHAFGLKLKARRFFRLNPVFIFEAENVAPV